jgi:hypothetical protein
MFTLYFKRYQKDIPVVKVLSKYDERAFITMAHPISLCISARIILIQMKKWEELGDSNSSKS